MSVITKLMIAATMVLGMYAFATAQCDPTVQSPIRCGYYSEGFQDGTRDAREQQSNNYQRYRNKYERQYESFYRDGYRDGYASIPTFDRWTAAQRVAYDLGYGFGSGDRGSRRMSAPQNYESRSGFAVRPYFNQGYMDGYTGIPRRYDFPIGSNPGYPGGPGLPGPGTGTGTVIWNGRVDDRIRVFVQGANVWGQNLTGTGFQQGSVQVNGVLPRRASQVTVRKLSGRGIAYIAEQPNRNNNFTAAVEISDTRSGSDDYRIEISWQASAANDQYSPGTLYWRGRVDDRVNIMVAGTDVWDEVITGGATTNVNFNINGYLASRPGSVRVNKREGRGTVRVVQNPSMTNGYVAVIEIFDSGGGADNYELEISW